MRRPLIWTGCLFFVGFFLLSTTAAWADENSPGKTPEFSAHPELDQVVDELTDLWEESPREFSRLDAARDMVIDWSEHSGHRPMNVARLLEGLGEQGLLPMLWALAADDPLALRMDLRAWRSWRIGLIEAVGRLRDDRSLPVLMAIIDGSERHAPIRQVATSALGRLGDEDSIEEVIDIARESTQRRAAIIAGLGQARRFVAAEYLLDVVETTQDSAEQRQAVRALGDWANQWAWQTSGLRSRLDERDEARDQIVQLLVGLFADADQSLATEIAKSLQLTGAEESAIAAIKLSHTVVNQDRRTRLQQLAERMAESPLD